MSKASRAAKIIALCAMNPHRVFLAFCTGFAGLLCSASEKIDDSGRWVGSFAHDKREEWPLLGKRIAESLSREYKQQAKDRSGEAAESILPVNQRKTN